MKNPVVTQVQTGGQIPTEGKSFISGKFPTRGKPSFSGQVASWGNPSFSGNVSVSTQLMARGQVPSPFFRNPQKTWGPPQGGSFNPSPLGGYLIQPHKEDL